MKSICNRIAIDVESKILRLIVLGSLLYIFVGVTIAKSADQIYGAQNAKFVTFHLALSILLAAFCIKGCFSRSISIRVTRVDVFTFILITYMVTSGLGHDFLIYNTASFQNLVGFGCLYFVIRNLPKRDVGYLIIALYALSWFFEREFAFSEDLIKYQKRNDPISEKK